jgi:hypothetical protein
VGRVRRSRRKRERGVRRMERVTAMVSTVEVGMCAMIFHSGSRAIMARGFTTSSWLNPVVAEIGLIPGLGC